MARRPGPPARAATLKSRRAPTATAQPSTKAPAKQRAAKRPVKKAKRRAAPPSGSRSAHPIRQVAARDAPIVRRLRELCLQFPEADERISHGEPTWFAGKGKVFAMLDNHHHASPHLSVWLPLPPGAQETLIQADAQRFFRPPYVGPSGWVGVVLDTQPDWTMVADLLRESFTHVATKKLVAQLAAAGSGPLKAL